LPSKNDLTIADRLDAWKTRYGTRDPAPLERLLAVAGERRWGDAASLIRLHETLLFLRAYPANRQIARLADSILFSFARRVAELPEDERAALWDPTVSGIAGSSLTAVFSYEVAQRLLARHPRNVEIAWDCYEEVDRLGPLLARLLPMMGEEWPVEAHVPFRKWIGAARGRSGTDLAWLLGRLDASEAESYNALQLPITWEMGSGATSRSRLRVPRRSLYCHTAPLLRRSDISLERELESAPLPVKRLARTDARKMLDLILDTSAMRYRELYGFSHPDETGVFHGDAGRGVDIYFFGVPPRWRLPLRAYHAGMFFKNGVPAGYIELLSLCERAETGFNLYYTFREGETAWLYARLLRLFRQVLGVNCFSVDPYQIGLENPEAIDSGAFWFYRKLGFRPVDPAVERLMLREEGRMRQAPGYRSSKGTLEKLAADCLIFEGPGAERGAWDHFRVRNLGLGYDGREESTGLELVMTRIPGLDRSVAAAVLRAKKSGSEARYLRLMQQDRRLRAGLLRLGSKHG